MVLYGTHCHLYATDARDVNKRQGKTERDVKPIRPEAHWKIEDRFVSHFFARTRKNGVRKFGFEESYGRLGCCFFRFVLNTFVEYKYRVRIQIFC